MTKPSNVLSYVFVARSVVTEPKSQSQHHRYTRELNSCLLPTPQLHSHLLGALNVGANMGDIRSILDQTGEVWGSEAQALVDGFWLDFEQVRCVCTSRAARMYAVSVCVCVVRR